MNMWLVYEQKEGDRVTYGIILTTNYRDLSSSSMDLLIYALAIIPGIEVPQHMYKDTLKQLEDYAKNQGHKRVLAYSNLESIYLIHHFDHE